MASINPGWYVLYTRPRHEKKIEIELSNQKISTFLPTTKKIRKWSDRMKYVEEPLFPSYLFVYLENIQHYFLVLKEIGSLYYLRLGKTLAKVDESIINSIKIAIQHESLVISDEKFKPGTIVHIKQGAFTGLPCEIVLHENINKIIVRLELLNRNIILKLSDMNFI